MSDDFPRHHLPSAEKSLEEGLAMRVILPKDLFSTLKISEKSRRKAEIKVLDGISVSVIVSDKFSILELPGDWMERLIKILPSSAMTINSESGARNSSNTTGRNPNFFLYNCYKSSYR
jgi:hypothetical protein